MMDFRGLMPLMTCVAVKTTAAQVIDEERHYALFFLSQKRTIYLRSTSHVDHWKRSALLDLLIGSDLDSSSSSPFIGFTGRMEYSVIAPYNCWLNGPLTGRPVNDRSDVTEWRHSLRSSEIPDFRVFQSGFNKSGVSFQLLATCHSRNTQHRRMEYSVPTLLFVQIYRDHVWLNANTIHSKRKDLHAPEKLTRSVIYWESVYCASRKLLN